jgi:hypothetical protein
MASLTTEYLEFYEQASQTNSYLLKQEFIKNNPALVRSLSRRFLKIEQKRAFYRVRLFIKKGDFLGALAEAVRNPSFFLALFMRLPGILKYHLSGRLTAGA